MIGSPAAKGVRAAAAQAVAGLMVPAAHGWLRRQEDVIRREGRPLNEDERAFGRRIGLRHADRVRILTVARIPLPAYGLLKRIGRFSRAILADPVALTAGYGIYCRRSIADAQEVLCHELVHVRQFERLGRRVFLKRYIRDCLVDGYTGAAF